jgi:hypothetical protein
VNTAVITTVSGRHRHLVGQRTGLRSGQVVPDLHVLVGMDDHELSRYAGSAALATALIEVPCNHGRLPLARARNVGARLAIERGADLLIFLDVDCIPGPRLVQRYQASIDAQRPHLLCGPIGYLPPAPPTGYPPEQLAALAIPDSLRPVPAEHEVIPDGDPTLFWSLSFAISRDFWLKLGGFCELYEGYGGEDTDFGQLAAGQGVLPTWVGGAWAFHQHHNSKDPPVQHLSDIVRNATIFRQRWGWWPMRGWLEQFRALGLADYDPAQDRWFSTAARVD